MERLYVLDYIQHNHNISQGRDALKAIVTNLSTTVYYQPGLIIAKGDLVALHDCIVGWADADSGRYFLDREKQPS